VGYVSALVRRLLAQLLGVDMYFAGHAL